LLAEFHHLVHLVVVEAVGLVVAVEALAYLEQEKLALILFLFRE
jgi:hypothetical protein